MPALTTAEMRAFLAEPGHLVRIGTVDERATGIWARHYYLPGTKMAKLADQPSSRGPYVARPS